VVELPSAVSYLVNEKKVKAMDVSRKLNAMVKEFRDASVCAMVWSALPQKQFNDRFHNSFK
jgi:hypothetical protein